MRPAFLNPLFASAQTLAGIGPRLIVLLKKCLTLPLGVSEPRVIDVLWHMPTGIIDRRSQPQLAAAILSTVVTLELRILKHKPSPCGNIKAPYKVICEDGTGRIDLVFFHSEHKSIEKQLPVGGVRLVSGRIERYGDNLQMTHPDYIVSPEARHKMPLLEPIYPLTAGLSGKAALKAARQAIDRIPEFPEWQESQWLKAREWPNFKDAIYRVHQPSDVQDVSSGAAPWQRLAFDELLAGQLAFALVRRNLKTERGRRLSSKGEIRTKIAAALPFSLTGSQKSALEEISADLAASHRMLRLLQGDVGSGKTVVAFIAMAIAVEAGAQATFMAPTEVLARQHIDTIAPLAETAGLRLALLTSHEKGKARDIIISRLASGKIDILVGTHSLFQSDVVFKDLAISVIDEQHRFGVRQRMALQAKGANGDTNVLVMTATPIPRTLLMTHYGDLDVSKLTERPAGRKSVVTKAAPLELLQRLVGRIRIQLEEGAQVYWVCPLIGSSEVTDLAAAEERFAYLRQLFGDVVGLLHGSMAGKDKDEMMAAFTENKLKILVATTVIEVGINVPNANIMVIEHAERFGLAQLHQLRGRVGRGSRKSFCMLLYKASLGETAEQRLKIMEETEDGFRIAEKDLELRRGGEILGARQSGAPGFRIAEVPGLEMLLDAAHDDVVLTLEKDPSLVSPRGRALRTLLYIFEYDEAVRFFQAA